MTVSMKSEPDFNYNRIYKYLSFQATSEPFLKHEKHSTEPRFPNYNPHLKEEMPDNKFTLLWRTEVFNSVERNLQGLDKVGILISGGIDSTSLLRVAREVNEDVEIHCFFVSVDQPNINEEKWMRKAIEGLDVDLHIVAPNSEEFWRDLPDLVKCLGEPIAGPSNYQMYRALIESKKYVKVVLNGQGPDELLGGYHAYIPTYLRELLRKKKLFSFAREAWGFRNMIWSKFAHGLRVSLGRRTSLLHEILQEDFLRNHKTIPNTPKTLNEATWQDINYGRLPELERAEDKTSEGLGVKLIRPLAEQSLIELSLSFPENMKLRNGWTKYVHREAMKGLIPEKIRLRRDKLGFAAPEAKWMKELSSEITEILSDKDLGFKEIFHQDKMIRSFKRHFDKYARLFWRIVFLNIWSKQVY